MAALTKMECDMPLDLSTKTRTSPDHELRRASSSSVEIINLLTKDGGKRNPCHACGIGFSSAKTLEAHQKFYCTKKDEIQLISGPALTTRQSSSPLQQTGPRRQSIMTTSIFIPDAPDRDSPVSQSSDNFNCKVRLVSPVSQTVSQSTNQSGKSGNYCFQCPFRANTVRGLRSHMTKCHFKDPSGLGGIKGKEPRPRTISSSRPSAVVVAPKRPKIDGVCPSVSGGFAEKKKHCKYCDISFKYLSTFLAHRKYYCTVRKVECPKDGAPDVTKV